MLFKILFSILLSIPVALYAQHDFDSLYEASSGFRDFFNTTYKNHTFFESNEIVRIAIISDFKTLNRRRDNEKYQDAVLEYIFNDSIIVRRRIGIKARGNFRREHCSYPPVKLNFPKKSVRLEWLQTFDKFKMVGSCKNGTAYQQYLLQEYYVYRIFNILTDYSFRVRLLHIDYKDISKKSNRTRQVRYAFIIEPIDAVAERLNCTVMNDPISSYALNEDNINMIAVFQYMIGNTDWSVPGLHNMRVLKSTNPDLFTPFAIPYDFDFCGIVNPPYAIPPEVLPIKTVRERLFRGPCRDFEVYRKTFDWFNSQKNKIYDLINNSELLTNGTKKQMMAYLDSFYRMMDRPKALEREFSISCIK